MLDIEKKIHEYEPKAKDIMFGQSPDQKYMLLKFRVGNKKHEITISSDLFELATAEIDKKYADVYKNFHEEVQEATKDIKEKYKEDIDSHVEQKTKIADDFVCGRITKYFDNK